MDDVEIKLEPVENDILVLHCNTPIGPKDLDGIMERITTEFKMGGPVLIPYYFDVHIVKKSNVIAKKEENK